MARSRLQATPFRAVAAASLTLLLVALTTCRSTPQPETRTVRIDEDGDGRIDLWRTLGPGGARETRAPAPGSDPPRTLVLAIDAIPHRVFADLQREGHFQAFFSASRLVAPFPSLTNVGFTAILRAPPAFGYEDLYFDPERDAFVGGVWDRLSGEYKEIAPFHEVFDWEEPRLWGAFAYYLPTRVAEAELLEIEQILIRFAHGEDPLPGAGERREVIDADTRALILYIGSTDALGHVGGRDELRQHLLRIEQVLDRFLAAGGLRDRIVLVSDHAMSETPSRMFDLETALERAGFSLTDALRDSSDVVAPAYGLVGSIQLYTAPGQEAAVARAVVAQEGADFAVWRKAGAGLEVPSEGHAADTKSLVIGAVDAKGSADPLDRPADEYPMLRERVRRALADHTRSPADVLVSLEDGWHHGSVLFDQLVDIVGTHGSARYTSSVGFLASNVDRTPAWIAAEDAYPWLGVEQDKQ